MYIHVIELYQKDVTYNEEAQWTSHATCFQVLELPQSHGHDWEGTLFSWLLMCYANLVAVRSEHFLCRGLCVLCAM